MRPEIVDDDTVAREEDELGILIQGTANEEQRLRRSPTLALKRKGGVSAAAKATSLAMPASKELGHVLKGGRRRGVPSDRGYVVSAVMSAPCDLSIRSDEIGILEDAEAELAWEGYQSGQ
jgi:hypothetical protein